MKKMGVTGKTLQEELRDLLSFLCAKYNVDIDRVFVEYSSRAPPSVRGNRAGYYDGLLSFRKKNGRAEFLITVFSVARNPLLTLAHEFAHLVNDLKSGTPNKRLAPPDDELERQLDDQANTVLAEYRERNRQPSAIF